MPMGFLLDFVCVVILAAAVLAYMRKPLFSAGLSCGVAALALVLSFFVSQPLSVLARPLLARGVEQQAAQRLADLYSAPGLSSPEETVKALDLTQMVVENPPAFQQVLDYFGVDIKELWALPLPYDSVEVLHTLTDGYIQVLSRSIVCAVLLLVCFLLGKAAARRLELERPPQPSPKGGRMALSAAIGLAAGLIWIFALACVLQWLAASVGAHFLLLSRQTLESASLYQILNQINPFIRL